MMNKDCFMIKTVLIPFKGKILYDTLITSNNLQFGPSYRKSFRELYEEIKKKKGIISCWNSY